MSLPTPNMAASAADELEPKDPQRIVLEELVEEELLVEDVSIDGMCGVY